MKKISKWLRAVAAPGILLIASAQNALAQNVGINQIEEIGTQVRQGAKAAVNVISIVVGLIAAIMLAWNYFKRSKGDGQSNDALASWGWGLIIVIIGLQVINIVFLR